MWALNQIFMLASLVTLALLLAFAGACGEGETQEASRHELPIFCDGSGLESFESDQGYEIEIEALTLRIERLEFTVGGEGHDVEQAWNQRVKQWFVPLAKAHPNHASGGEVAGEFIGPAIAQCRPGQLEQLGHGSFLEGSYAGYNVVFGGGEDDSTADTELLDAGLMGSIRGQAHKEGETVDFIVEAAHFDSADIIGGALSGTIADEHVPGVAIGVLAFDSWSVRSILDGVAFSGLSVDSDGLVRIEDGSLAHAEIRSAMTAHKFYTGRILDDGEL